MSQVLSRQALYDLVWCQPKTVLAKQFGFSDVWLSKICRAANVPIPPRGYWARIASGQNPPKFLLPARELGQIDEVTIGKARWNAFEDPTDLPPPPVFEGTLEEVTAKAKKRLGRLTTARTLTAPHHLIAELLGADDRRRKEAEGNVWDQPIFDDATARRRLKILNALFLALNKAGFRPTLHGKAAEQPGVVVGDFHVSFKLEKILQRSNPAKRSSGRSKEPLYLEIPNWTDSPAFPKQSWRDTESESLEHLLPEIALSLVVAGEMLYRGDVLRNYEWLVKRKNEREERIRAEKEEAERAAERARQAELERRREALFQAAEDRRKAAQIRALVSDLGRLSATHLPDFVIWKAWALDEADRIDPLCQAFAQLINCSQLDGS